jgi:hypothetical protein
MPEVIDNDDTEEKRKYQYWYQNKRETVGEIQQKKNRAEQYLREYISVGNASTTYPTPSLLKQIRQNRDQIGRCEMAITGITLRTTFHERLPRSETFCYNSRKASKNTSKNKKTDSSEYLD